MTVKLYNIGVGQSFVLSYYLWFKSICTVGKMHARLGYSMYIPCQRYVMIFKIKLYAEVGHLHAASDKLNLRLW